MFHNSQFLSLYRRIKVRMFVMSNEISAGKRIGAQKNGKVHGIQFVNSKSGCPENNLTYYTNKVASKIRQ